MTSAPSAEAEDGIGDHEARGRDDRDAHQGVQAGGAARLLPADDADAGCLVLHCLILLSDARRAGCVG